MAQKKQKLSSIFVHLQPYFEVVKLMCCIRKSK
jgi:hypothetical protein